MDIKEAKEHLKEKIKNDNKITSSNTGILTEILQEVHKDNLAIETVLSELDKKDKIIDEMIQEYEYNAGINVKDFCDEEIRKEKCIQDCINCIKKYFTNKAMSEKPTEGE